MFGSLDGSILVLDDCRHFYDVIITELSASELDGTQGLKEVTRKGLTGINLFET
jgi:hypothetical protein